MTPDALRAERLTGGVEPRTQREVADALGVTTNTVARWERGERAIPPWVDRIFAGLHRLRDTEQALARELAKCERLRQKLEDVKAERTRAGTRRRS